jgi:predicted metalloprotease with PDZ domain
LLPTDVSGFSSAASSTENLLVLSWNEVVLYPQGTPAESLLYAARLRIPSGWKYATALLVAREDADAIEFAPAPLTTLIDSPVITGRY